MRIFECFLFRRGRPGTSRVANLIAGLVALSMTTAFCFAQSGLSADARRDIELRPGVVRIDIVLAGSFAGVGCKREWGGTGFLYRPDGYLITNGHVAQLANTKDPEAIAAQKKEIFQSCLGKKLQEAAHGRLTNAEVPQIMAQMKVVSALTVILDNESHFEGEIKAYSDPITSGGKDVAVIKIDGNNLPTVPLGDSDKVNVNDHVYVIGYPGAAEVSNASIRVATSSDGTISAIKNRDYTGTPLLQTNTNINHGDSGGPAFDSMGQVIGIATFGRQDAPGYNFLVPISTAKEFIRAAGGEPERGAFDKKWHEALDAYSNQRWTTAHSLLGDVLEMMPNQPEAQRLRLLAAGFVDKENWFQQVEEKTGPGGLIAAVVIGLIAIGAIVWLILRNKNPAGAPKQADGRHAQVPIIPPTAGAVIEAFPKSVPAAAQSFGDLHVSGGALTGNRFPIPKAGLIIGRDPTKCSIVVAEDSVGKEHAWVVPLDNGVAVIDRNSTNGTYVNATDSSRINKVILRHGDRIYLGKTSGTVFTYYSRANGSSDR